MMSKIAEIVRGPNRLYLYVPVPEAVQASLEKIAKHVIPGGVTPAEMDHITMVFVPKADADIPEVKVDKVCTALREAAEGIKPMHARVQGWAYFDGAEKDGEKTTALVALVTCPGLDALQVELVATLRRLGIEPSDRYNFNPHITACYLEHGKRVDELPVLDESFDIDKVVLVNRDTHDIRLTGGASLGMKAATFAVT